MFVLSLDSHRRWSKAWDGSMTKALALERGVLQVGKRELSLLESGEGFGERACDLKVGTPWEKEELVYQDLSIWHPPTRDSFGVLDNRSKGGNVRDACCRLF